MSQEVQEKLLQHKINRVFIYNQQRHVNGRFSLRNECLHCHLEKTKKQKTLQQTNQKTPSIAHLQVSNIKNIAGEGSTSAAKIYKFLP